MGDLLQQTLDLYAEPWMQDHEEVMAKYKAADGMGEVCSFGIFLYERLMRKLDNDGTARVQQVQPALQALKNWYLSTSHVLNMAAILQSEGFPVNCDNHLGQLQDYHIQSGPIIEELTDASRAIESVKAGTAQTLSQYIAELRNPPN